jgi:hypothetical protein
MCVFTRGAVGSNVRFVTYGGGRGDSGSEGGGGNC